MRLRSTVMIIGLVLLASACASEQSESEQASSDAGSSDTTAVTVEADGGDESATNDAASSDDAVPSASGDGSTATVTLENGEAFTFGILCGLETQIAADQEILFTVVSYDDPVSLDVTQFGDEAVVAGTAIITLYDSSTYDTLWEANTLHGGEVELELNGSTVTGHGVFVEGGELGNPSVPGELVANC